MFPASSNVSVSSRCTVPSWESQNIRPPSIVVALVAGMELTFSFGDSINRRQPTDNYTIFQKFTSFVLLIQMHHLLLLRLVTVVPKSVSGKSKL